MKPSQISLKDAQKIIISAQALGPNSLDSVGKVVQHLGHVQIDTINVVERAHHHVLWSRLPQYRPKDLEQSLNQSDGIFEYWAHARSYLPMQDYRFSLPLMEKYQQGKKHWFETDKKVIKNVLKRIQAEGPLSVSDFERSPNSGSGWFERSPAKKAMEQLFMSGQLMVSSRQGFRIFYDLRERILPFGINTTTPTLAELAEYKIIQFLKAQGIGRCSEIAYLNAPLKSAINKKLKDLQEEKIINEIKISSLDSTEAFYAFTNHTQNPASIELKKIKILSPFDNLVIQRKRLLDFFDFDYIIECYTPEAKRKFGYFTLPILDKTKLIGRIDVKAIRQSRVLQVRSVHWENSPLPNTKLNVALNDFAEFNGCNLVEF